MHTVEVFDELHEGWPNPDSVKGFTARISPGIAVDYGHLSEVLSSETLEGVSIDELRVTFEDSVVAQKGGDMTVIFGGSTEFWYGVLGSRMHESARRSFDARLGFLLQEQGIEVQP